MDRVAVVECTRFRLRGWLWVGWTIAALACAAPSGRAPDGGGAAASRGAQAEDASVRLLGEDEVDTAAAPAAPIRPEYPPRARALGLEGSVMVRVRVLADGRYAGAELIESTHEWFTHATRDALRLARFEPALHEGRRVASTLTLRFRFRLEE